MRYNLLGIELRQHYSKVAFANKGNLLVLLPLLPYKAGSDQQNIGQAIAILPHEDER